MKNKLLAVLIISVLITLSIQAVMLSHLNYHINQLSMQLSQAGTSQISLPKLPALMPPKQDCVNELAGQHIESF